MILDGRLRWRRGGNILFGPTSREMDKLMMSIFSFFHSQLKKESGKKKIEQEEYRKNRKVKNSDIWKKEGKEP